MRRGTPRFGCPRVFPIEPTSALAGGEPDIRVDGSLLERERTLRGPTRP